MSIVSIARHKPVQLPIYRLFDDIFEGFEGLIPFDRLNGDAASDFRPKLNVKETKKSVLVTAELPGMDEKDVKIELNDDVLTISGEKKVEKEEKDEHWHRIETSYGTFQRSLALTANVDRDKITADYKKGILKITLPKVKEEPERKKTIEIKAA